MVWTTLNSLHLSQEALPTLKPQRLRRSNDVTYFHVLGLVSVAAVAWSAWTFILSGETDSEIQRREIIRKSKELRRIRGAPATILVAGFPGHGKSSFVNSIFRVMKGETGPLIRRAETGPSGCNRPVTATFKLYPLKINTKELQESTLINIVDSPPFDPSMDRELIKEAFTDLIQQPFTEETTGYSILTDCIVLVISTLEASCDINHSYESTLTTATQAIRAAGVPCLIVVTKVDLVHKEITQGLVRAIQMWCSTESVYTVKNYGAKVDHKEEEEIKDEVLHILRQALEFIP